MKGQLLGRRLHKLQALFSAFGEGFGRGVGVGGGSSSDPGGGVLSPQRVVHVQSPHQLQEKQHGQAPCTYSCVS